MWLTARRPPVPERQPGYDDRQRAARIAKAGRPPLLAVDHDAVAVDHRGGLLSPHAVERRIAVRCRRYETALATVAAGDLLLTLPRRQAMHHRGALAIRLFRAPVPIPAMQVRMYWHRQTDDDPAQRWIRDQVRRCIVRRATP